MVGGGATPVSFEGFGAVPVDGVDAASTVVTPEFNAGATTGVTLGTITEDAVGAVPSGDSVRVDGTITEDAVGAVPSGGAARVDAAMKRSRGGGVFIPRLLGTISEDAVALSPVQGTRACTFSVNARTGAAPT